MNEEIKKEIEEYLKSKDFHKSSTMVWYQRSNFYIDIIIETDKGNSKDLYERYEREPIVVDKYFLEFIGHILRKYNIKKFSTCNAMGATFKIRTYRSTKWKYDNIIEI